MPERPCRGMAGHVYHVMNRATVGQVFDRADDYGRFLCTLQQARAKVPMRVLSYCLMPNHWHLLLWPAADDDLMRFAHWLTGTHAQRVHASRGTRGRGAIYQGRYLAVAVNDDAAFLRVARYVERNPVRARLTDRVEEWLWSSACARLSTRIDVARWPVPRPAKWTDFINDEEPALELADIRTRVACNQAIGTEVATLAIAGARADAAIGA
jgi:putative transposase